MRMERLQHAFFRLQLTAKRRRAVYEALTLMAENHVDIQQGIKRLYRVISGDGKYPKRVAALMLQDVLSKLKNGWTSGEALALWIPANELMLIRAGEMSGRPASGYCHAVVLIEAQQKIREAIAKAATYPVVLLVALGFLMNLLSIEVIPQLEKVVPASAWQGPAGMLYHLSHWTRDYGIGVALLCITTVGILVLTLSRFVGKWRAYLERFPPWSVYRMVNGSMFLLAIAVLLRDGVPIKVALDSIAKDATPWLRERVQAICYGLGVGLDFAQGLANSGFDFPDPEAIQYVQMLGQQSGFQEPLYRFSQRWLEQGVKRIEELGKVMLSIGIVVIATLMGLLFIGVNDIQSAMIK